MDKWVGIQAGGRLEQMDTNRRCWRSELYINEIFFKIVHFHFRTKDEIKSTSDHQ